VYTGVFLNAVIKSKSVAIYTIDLRKFLRDLKGNLMQSKIKPIKAITNLKTNLRK